MTDEPSSSSTSTSSSSSSSLSLANPSRKRQLESSPNIPSDSEEDIEFETSVALSSRRKEKQQHSSMFTERNVPDKRRGVWWLLVQASEEDSNMVSCLLGTHNFVKGKAHPKQFPVRDVAHCERHVSIWHKQAYRRIKTAIAQSRSFISFLAIFFYTNFCKGGEEVVQIILAEEAARKRQRGTIPAFFQETNSFRNLPAEELSLLSAIGQAGLVLSGGFSFHSLGNEFWKVIFRSHERDTRSLLSVNTLIEKYIPLFYSLLCEKLKSTIEESEIGSVSFDCWEDRLKHKFIGVCLQFSSIESRPLRFTLGMIPTDESLTAEAVSERVQELLEEFIRGSDSSSKFNIALFLSDGASNMTAATTILAKEYNSFTYHCAVHRLDLIARKFWHCSGLDEILSNVSSVIYSYTRRYCNIWFTLKVLLYCEQISVQSILTILFVSALPWFLPFKQQRKNWKLQL